MTSKALNHSVGSTSQSVPSGGPGLHPGGETQRQRLTVGLHGQWHPLAEDALGADFQVDGGEAEVVAAVVHLGLGHVQIARRLGDEEATVVRRQKVWEVVEEPAVEEGYGNVKKLSSPATLNFQRYSYLYFQIFTFEAKEVRPLYH